MRQPDDIDDMPWPEETPDCHGKGGMGCNCPRCLAADEKAEQMGAEARGK